MKIKRGFISNSSSCSFIISNNSNSDKKLLDFAKETLSLLHEFNKEYDYNWSEEDFLEDAKNLDLNIPIGSNIYIFGDEHDGMLNTVYDYMLRNGGSSNNFSWEFEEFLR